MRFAGRSFEHFSSSSVQFIPRFSTICTPFGAQGFLCIHTIFRGALTTLLLYLDVEAESGDLVHSLGKRRPAISERASTALKHFRFAVAISSHSGECGRVGGTVLPNGLLPFPSRENA